MTHVFASGVRVDVGLASVRTQGGDYYGTPNGGETTFEKAQIAFPKIAGTNWSVTLGRQDVEIGDGFLVGDGYVDRRGAVYAVPLNHWDGGRVDWSGESLSLTGVVLKLSEDDPNRPQRGALYGADLSWRLGETGLLGVGHFRRNDSGRYDTDAVVTSVRGGWSNDHWLFSGEYALEGGTRQGASLDANGWHADAAFTFAQTAHTPYLRGSVAQFTGDDPATAEDEAFFPFHYRAHDWNQYYYGDLASSLLLDNSDKQVLLAEAGFKPTAGTRLRAVATRHTLQTGTCFDLEPGAPRHLADEVDVIYEFSFGDNWSAWLLGGVMKPGDAARLVFSRDRTTAEVAGSVTYKF